MNQSVSQIEPLTTPQDESLLALLEQYLESVETDTQFDRQRWISRACEQNPELADEIRESVLQIDSLSLLAGSDPLPTPTIEGYSITRRLGQGGAGVVYEAVEEKLGRKVALKVFPAAFDPATKAHARFMIEAQAAARLDHPNIVPIYRLGGDGVSSSPCFLSMKLIEGRSLDRMIASPGFPFGQDAQNANSLIDVQASAVRWTIVVAEAIEEAHSCGIVHRDIKPSNLIVDVDDRIWVTDFGLARLSNNDAVSLTQTGDRVGTMAYMSPEQAAGQPTDGRTDVYSLGLTLFELLTARRAIEGETIAQVQQLRDQTDSFHVRTLDTSLDRDLDVIVAKATSRELAERYQTPADFAADLRRYERCEPILATPPSWVTRGIKWTKRHRRLVLTAAGCLLLAVAASWLVLARLAIANGKTQDALASSQANLQRSEEILDRFGLLAAEKLRDVKGAESVRRELLKQTLLYYEDYANRIDGNDGFTEQNAITHFKAAQIIDEIGADADAMKAYERASRLFEQAGELSPMGHRTRALTWNDLAVLKAESGWIEQAEELYERVLATDLSGVDRARACGNYAMLNIQVDNPSKAINLLEDGLHVIDEDETTESHVARSMLLSQLAFVLKDLNTVDSLATANRVISLLETQPVNAETTRMTAIAYANRAAIQSDNLAIAASDLIHARDLLSSMTKSQGHDRTFLAQVAKIQNDLGRVLVEYGEVDASIGEFLAAEKTLLRLQSSDSTADHYAASLAGVLHNLGRANAIKNSFAHAMEYYQRSLKLQQSLLTDTERLTEPMRLTSQQLLKQTLADIRLVERRR